MGSRDGPFAPTRFCQRQSGVRGRSSLTKSCRCKGPGEIYWELSRRSTFLADFGGVVAPAGLLPAVVTSTKNFPASLVKFFVSVPRPRLREVWGVATSPVPNLQTGDVFASLVGWLPKRRPLRAHFEARVRGGSSRPSKCALKDRAWRVESRHAQSSYSYWACQSSLRSSALSSLREFPRSFAFL